MESHVPQNVSELKREMEEMHAKYHLQIDQESCLEITDKLFHRFRSPFGDVVRIHSPQWKQQSVDRRFYNEERDTIKVTRVGTLAPPKTEGQLSICQQVNSFQWIIINLILFPR